MYRAKSLPKAGREVVLRGKSRENAAYILYTYKQSQKTTETGYMLACKAVYGGS